MLTLVGGQVECLWDEVLPVEVRDIRYPSDAVLALQGARSLTREGRKLQKLTGSRIRVRDRSRSIGKKVRAISRTLARRTGEAKAQVMVFNEQAGRLIKQSAN